MGCGTNSDFMFPLEADIYYPIVEQQAYGGVQKTWILDRTISCSFAPAGTAWGEEVKPNVNITQNSILFGRVREDIRKSSRDSSNSIVNVIVTNIRDRNCNPVYLETAGIRSGKSTIFELATNEPIVGPFGSVEYYKLVIRRSENQAADV
jgi:hypothetical protein